jgi:hypothetical protein
LRRNVVVALPEITWKGKESFIFYEEGIILKNGGIR